MNKLLATITLCALMAGSAFAQNPIDRREHRQNVRIRHGIRNDQLTRMEARRLAAEQVRIRKAEARIRADGNVTAIESRRLDRRLDAANRRIFRQKHDAQQRP